MEDTVSGVTLRSVNVDGKSCTLEYGNVVRTVKKGIFSVWQDGTYIGVHNVIPSNREGVPDYCTVLIILDDAIRQTIAVDDTIVGVTLMSVDVDGNSCTVRYDGSVKTVNNRGYKFWGDGTLVVVEDVYVANQQAVPDYCALIIA